MTAKEGNQARWAEAVTPAQKGTVMDEIAMILGEEAASAHAIEVAEGIYSTAPDDEPGTVRAKMRPTTITDVVDVLQWVGVDRLVNRGELDLTHLKWSQRKKARRVAHAFSRIARLPAPVGDKAVAAVLVALDERMKFRKVSAQARRQFNSANGEMNRVLRMAS